MAQQAVFIAPRFLIKFEFKQIRRIEFILDRIEYTGRIEKKNVHQTTTNLPRKQPKKS